MKVSWKQFAQRRKITLDMFSTLSFEEYCEWCKLRNVVPVTKEVYRPNIEPVEATNKTTVKEVKEETPEVTNVNHSTADLRKMKKIDLENLCIDKGIKLPQGATKRQLLKLLTTLNN